MRVRRKGRRGGLVLVMAVSIALPAVLASGAQAATPVNLALGKYAVATLPPCTPTSDASRAVDGQTSNIYTDKWCALKPGTQVTLQVDLGRDASGAEFGGTYSVTQFVVKHAGLAGESPAYNTKDFKIQTSTDGWNFYDRAIVLGNTANVTTVSRAPFSARFVRLTINRGTQYSELIDAARIYEFEVWGTP